MKRLCVLSAVLSLALFAMTAKANLLVDPGFEAATTETRTSNSPWVLDANQPDGSSYASQFRFANWSGYPGGPDNPGMGVWFQAFEGDQADPPGTDALAQATVSQVVGVGGGAVLGSVTQDLNLTSPKDGSWNQYSVMAAAPAGTVGVRAFAQMIDGMDAGANPQSGFVDEFDLTEAGGVYTLSAFHKAETNFTSGQTLLGIEFLGVPEPTSLALAGMGLLGILGLRRQR